MPRGSNDELSQGARANNAGRTYEDMLIAAFQNYGFEVISHRDWLRRQPLLETKRKLAIRNYPYRTIYDHRGKTEWVLINDDRGIVVRVEIKTQRSSGSVDEKFPYMYLNAVQAYPEDEIILLVEGNGFKEGAKTWLRNAIDSGWLLDEGSSKHIQMMNLSEFVEYFIEHLS